jgi:uncharacterized protein (DUF2252 family)
MSTTTSAASVVDEIIEFNHSRKSKLVRIKFARMSADLFSFFRATDHLYARAWPELKPPDVGPSVLICGDLHLENVGAYRTDEGDFRFDLNDFDEALVAPCSLDVVRCAASILLAAEVWNLTPIQASGMALAFLDQYRAAVAEAVERHAAGEIAPRSGHGPLWELLGATASATQADLLARYTRPTKGRGQVLIRIPDKIYDIKKKRADEVASAVEEYGQTTATPDAYKVLDVAGRIAGLGSLGLRRYVVMVAGGGSPSDRWVLDIKEGCPPCQLCCTQDPQPGLGDSDAARSVAAQRLLQSRPAAGLGVLTLTGRAYRVREAIPEANRSSLDHLRKRPERLRAAVEVVGRLAGWSQFRGSRGCGLERSDKLAEWAVSSAFDAVLAAAARCTERTRVDFEEFRSAYAAGRVRVKSKT